MNNNPYVAYFLNYVKKIQGMYNTLHGLFKLKKNWQMNFFILGKLIHKGRVHDSGLKGVLKTYRTYNMLMHYLKVKGNLLTFSLWIQFKRKLTKNIRPKKKGMQLHGFLSEKMSQKKEKEEKKKKKRKSDNWMDWYLRSRCCQFFIQKLHSLHCVNST